MPIFGRILDLNPSCRARFLVSLACGALAVAATADADDILIDDQDCLDWARVLDGSTWKQKDACLTSQSLIKFNLEDLGPVSLVEEATLHLFIERGAPGGEITICHVHDDSWSYELTGSGALHAWPCAHVIGTAATPDTMALTVDVTSAVAEEMAAAGDRLLSFKLTVPGYAPVRVTSPLASRWRMAPRLNVRFQLPPGSPPLPPDLTLSTGDISCSPMQPVPGDAVQVSARVRNNSATSSGPTEVAFFEGAPAGTNIIGTALLPPLAPGGGAASVSVSWPDVSRGLHEVYVVVDPDDLVAEAEETNNEDFRGYLVEAQYSRYLESFEYPGLRGFHTDFEFPIDFQNPVPKPGYLERSGASPCHGDHALEVIVDGTGDDGSLWIERAVPVDRNSRYRVSLEWLDQRYNPDIAFIAIAAAGVLDPEIETDFSLVGLPPQGGCTPQVYETTVDTGPYDHLWVACGITITWETPGILGIDSVAVEVSKVVGAPEPSPIQPGNLTGPVPNPSAAGAEMRFVLPARGRVEAEVYDVSGRCVRTLLGGVDGPGPRTLRWDGVTSAGKPAAPGVYIVRARADGKPLGEQRLVIVR